MAKKKSVKAGSKAKTKHVSDPVGKESVSLRELPGRHMRLTQEFDRLSTMVARQGQLLQGIYLVLQQARLMPYAPEQMGVPVKASQFDNIGRPDKKFVLDGAAAKGGRGHAFPISGRGTAPMKYDIVLKRNGQILGYLTETGTWTLDPNKIKTWIPGDDQAEVMLSKVSVPEGAKAEIRGHS